VSTIIFGFAAGIVIAAAGTSFTDQPWKFVALAFMINAAHHFTKD
jgi:hypothetical protein